jgi:hypothetical protein
MTIPVDRPSLDGVRVRPRVAALAGTIFAAQQISGVLD